jgi:hypothetical protein
MALITHKLTHTFTPPSGVSALTTITESITGNAEFNFQQVVPVAANTQYHLAFTQANLQSVCLAVSAPGVTGTVTVYTNNPSGSAPQDTVPLTLTASGGQVLEWTLQTNLIAKCPFSGNVTTIYITNAASGPVTVSIYGLLNQ